MKNRVRRCGGDDVGWEVSALRSHWMTEILLDMSLGMQRSEENIDAPYCAVEASWAEPKSLAYVL